jgi:hypothetical protein
MENAPYVLGIDGLPFGSAAVAVAGGRVTATFSIPPTLGRAGLRARVEVAVDEAAAALGLLPVEVRVVCIDDGGDGSEASLAADWLAARGVSFRLLDLVGPEGSVAPDATVVSAQHARSLERARDAALW